MGIRAAAAEIGVSPATLSRVERGHLPDSRTLGKICTWLAVDPGRFIGGAAMVSALPAVQIAFKSGQTFTPRAAQSLASLITAAHQAFVEKKIAPEGH